MANATRAGFASGRAARGISAFKVRAMWATRPRSAALRTTKCGSASARRSCRFVSSGGGGASRRFVAHDLLRAVPPAAGGEAYASSISLRPSDGTLMTSRLPRGHGDGRCRASPITMRRGTICHLMAPCRDHRVARRRLRARPRRGDRGQGGTLLLGAGARRGQPDFHRPGLLRRRASRHRADEMFGIDRLLAEPDLRSRSKASASRWSRTRPRSPATSPIGSTRSSPPGST